MGTHKHYGSLAIPDLKSAWTTYTPTWAASSSAPSVGNGSLAGEYAVDGNGMVDLRLKLTFGSTTSPGSGYYTIGLPLVSAWQVDDPIGSGTAFDAGVLAHQRTALQFGTNRLYLAAESGALVANNNPFTFGSGDAIIVTARYRRA